MKSNVSNTKSVSDSRGVPLTLSLQYVDNRIKNHNFIKGDEMDVRFFVRFHLLLSHDKCLFNSAIFVLG